MSDTFRKVPELSLLSYVNGDDAQKAQFVSKLFNGIKDYGFIILTDHTITQDIIDKGYAAVKEFFAMPEEEKNKYILEGNAGQRGYTPFGKEHAKDNPHKDLKEFYHVGREVCDDHKFAKYYPKNLFPQTSICDFKQATLDLYNELDNTSKILLEALGKALDVPANYFSDMIDTGNSVLRAIHYPAVGEAPPAGSIRAAAHGDINLITILMGATAGGLQLLDRDGTWLDVESKEGQLVVDAGDMMSRITNEVIPATIHRVVNPPDATSARFSMPFFVHPHPEAMLECIPSCEGEGAKFPPIKAQDCLEERLKDIGLM